MYEYTAYYNQYNVMGYNGHRYDMNQVNMVGSPLNMMNQMPQQVNSVNNSSGNTNPPMNIPPTMMRPNGNEMPGSNLGFQMNPVSKNSKKK